MLSPLWWFDPGQQLSTHQLLIHTPLIGMGERNGWANVRKTSWSR